MADDRKDLPPVSSPNFQEKAREALSVYLGNRGSKLDRGLTVRDLADAGLAGISDAYLAGRSKSPLTGPGSAFDPVFGTTEPDLMPPPTPSGFSASAGITSLMVECDAPVYPQGHGHAKSILYGASWISGDLPVFATAVPLTEFTGSIASHATNPATTWHLWLTWVTVDGVESTAPAGGTNGLVVKTGEDVALLLEVLTGEVTASQLHADLGRRVDLIDGAASLDGSVAFRVAEEAAARAASDAAEASARVSAVSLESIARTAQVQDAAYAALEATLAANNINAAVRGDVALAKLEIKQDVVNGVSAEATQRLLLAAKLDTDIGTTLAAITDESTARSTAVTAEATARQTLASQLLGADGTGLTAGLIYTDRSTQVTQNNALAQQITLLSAGAGEQFDWQSIWYFDAGTESWTGNGTPTASGGFLRPANQASGAYTESPIGIAADGLKYSQVRLRARKVGNPTWAGYLWWRAATDGTWDAARRVAMSAPTWDAVTGIGLVTVNPAWAVTIDKLRIDLSSAQTATDYFDLDWVAIGRPSPGASSAQLLNEQAARVDAVGAVVEDYLALHAQVNDPVTGVLKSVADIVVNYSTKSSRDSAIATAQTTLAAKFGPQEIFRQDAAPTQVLNHTPVVLANSTTAYLPKLAIGSAWYDTNDGNKPHTWDGLAWVYTPDLSATATSAFIDRLDTAFADPLNATTSGIMDAVSAVSDPVTGLLVTQASILEKQTTQAGLTSALVRDSRTLVAKSNDLAEATLRNILTEEATRTSLEGSLALAKQELKTDIVDGLSAEAAARLVLLATVDANTAALTSEQLTRATQTGALATRATALEAAVIGIDGALATKATTSYVDTAKADAISAAASTTALVQAQLSPGGSAALAVAAAASAASAAQTSADAAAAAAIEQASLADISARSYADGIVSDEEARAISDATAKANAARIAAEAAAALDATAKANVAAAAAAAAAVNAATAQTTANAAVTASGANAISISDVQARLNSGDYAAVKVESSANASAVTGLGAQYTVKLDVNGKVSGYGLASTGPAGAGSIFEVRSDKFVIAAPTGSAAGYVPFSVLAAPTVIDGITLPAGVYAQNAFIQDAQITNAKIGNLAVDDAKISALSATKLTVGDGTIGGNLKSANYVAGTSGWVLKPNGTAEFGAAAIRGQLTASQIDTRGLTIRDASNNIILNSGASLQSQIAPYAYGADVTSNNIAAGITGQGSLATASSVTVGSTVKFPDGSTMGTADFVSKLSKVSSGTINNFFDGAAITNAYIGDLAVDYVKIGNNAATYAFGTAVGTGSASQDAWIAHDAEVIVIGSAAHGSSATATIKINGYGYREVLAQGSVAMVFKTTLTRGWYTFEMATTQPNASLAVLVSYK